MEVVVQHFETDSIYQKMGLKEGDVIKKWNGKEIVSREDSQFIDKTINEATKFTAVVDRDGTEMTFHYIKPKSKF